MKIMGCLLPFRRQKNSKSVLGWSPTSPLWGNNGFRLFFGGSQTLFGSLFFLCKGGATHDFEEGRHAILRKGGTRFWEGVAHDFEKGRQTILCRWYRVVWRRITPSFFVCLKPRTIFGVWFRLVDTPFWAFHPAWGSEANIFDYLCPRKNRYAEKIFLQSRK